MERPVGKALLHGPPDIFNDVHVWSLGGPLKNHYPPVFQQLCHRPCHVDWAAVLLEVEAAVAERAVHNVRQKNRLDDVHVSGGVEAAIKAHQGTQSVLGERAPHAHGAAAAAGDALEIGRVEPEKFVNYFVSACLS